MRLKFTKDYNHTLAKAGSPTLSYKKRGVYNVPQAVADEALAAGAAEEVKSSGPGKPPPGRKGWRGQGR